MKTSIRINFRNVAAIVACLAVTTVFASCEPADVPNPDAPAVVEFSFANQRGASDIDAKKRTVKAVAECGTNIASIAPAFRLSPEGATATVDGKPQESGKTANNFADAVVYTLAAPDGTTAEWTVTITLLDDCPTVTTLFSYNPPAGYYLVQKYTDSDNSTHNYGFAYGSGKYAKIESDNEVSFHQNSQYYYYSSYNNRTGWADYHKQPDSWNTPYNINNVWSRPCYHFNLYLCNLEANRQGETDFFPLTWDNALADWEVDLQNYDATKYYVRSEKVNNVDCNVFSGLSGTSQKYTFWVDKTNGLTLKFTYEKSGKKETWEITTYQLTEPDWDVMHLRPQAGDEVVEP